MLGLAISWRCPEIHDWCFCRWNINEKDDIPPPPSLLVVRRTIVQCRRSAWGARSGIEYSTPNEEVWRRHRNQNDCNNAPTSGLRQNENKAGDADSSSSSTHVRSDGQDGKCCSLSTPLTSVAGSEAKCDLWSPRWFRYWQTAPI